MSQFVDGPTKTFTAGAALAVGTRVTLSSGVLAAADEDTFEIGTVERESFASGEEIAVRLATASGTFKMVAAADFAADAVLYAAADGEVDDSGTIQIGVALEAAGAAGDIVEVARIVGNLDTDT